MCQRSLTSTPRCGCIVTTKTKKCRAKNKPNFDGTCANVTERTTTDTDAVCESCEEELRAAVYRMRDKRGMVHSG